jgi:hypothetical protein
MSIGALDCAMHVKLLQPHNTTTFTMSNFLTLILFPTPIFTSITI